MLWARVTAWGRGFDLTISLLRLTIMSRTPRVRVGEVPLLVRSERTRRLHWSNRRPRGCPTNAVGEGDSLGARF